MSKGKRVTIRAMGGPIMQSDAVLGCPAAKWPDRRLFASKYSDAGDERWIVDP